MEKFRDKLIKWLSNRVIEELEENIYQATLNETSFAEKFYKYISDDLVEYFGIDNDSAYKMIKMTHVPKLLMEYPEYVYHYNIEYWSNEIAEFFISIVEI